ncbi:MAG TPA: S-layer homology domain-containing protein [Candidatus Ornithomonoglobus intestinigallinarum]|uniref:S-layer homology domain-containing protein n=1 Tax=Candidatus Ornithomonoglobus intestinigallinarum TaxID=2840894 RepID=A0A9D1H3G0_9FIRM|nr:S-layer homology domain-containing protein [Candidatus Ornithomonoglobus intestinigallinarum]
MIRNKFKKLIALASAAAMVASVYVPIATAAENPVEVTPSETAYIDGISETGTAHPGKLLTNYSKPEGDVFVHGNKDNVGQAALVKFDLSEYVGKVRSAEISLHSQCTVSGKNSEVNFSSIGTDWSQDTVTWSNQTGIAPISERIAALGFASSSGADFSYDLTDMVRADEDGILAFAFYTSTGRQQELTNVKLNLVVADEVIPRATITVNNVLEDGTVIESYTVEGLYEGDSYRADPDMTNDKTKEEHYYTMSDGAVTTIDSVYDGAVLDIRFEEVFQEVFISQNFNDSEVGTWGFTTNSGVSLTADGALDLCTVTAESTAGAFDTRTFDTDFPNMLEQTFLEVSFRWKTNVDLNASGGRYSWFSLRDTEENPIFVIIGTSSRGAYEDNSERLRQISYGYDETETFDGFKQIENPTNDFYKVQLNLNFAVGTMTGKITDSNGNVVANINQPLTAKNLGGLKAYHGEGSASMTIDDFKVFGPKMQKISFTVTDEEGKPVGNATVKVGDQTVLTDAEGKAALDLIANTTYNVEITKAQYQTYTQELVLGEEDVEIPVSIMHLSDENFVKDVIANMDIANGTTVVKSDGDYIVSGDFTLPSPSNVTVTWSTNAENGEVVIDGSKAEVYPKADGADTITLKANVAYGTYDEDVSYTLDITDYKAAVKAPVDDAVADKTVNPNDDRTGSYGTPDAAEGKFALDTFTAENPLSFDLYLPSSVSGNSNLKQTWSVTGDGLDVDGEVAALAVDNTEANSAKITKTVAFVKNGTTLYSASADYDVTVQFDPAAVDEMTDKWAETSGEEDVKSTFFYAYQLKLDAASEKNFADMPDEGTDISTSGISNLNYGGEDSVFGSLIEWTSSQSTYASVSKSNKKVTVNRSSFSGTKDITLTATIYIEGYSKNETRAFKYEITGTKSSSSSGGGSGRPSTGGGGTIPVPVVTPTPAPVVTPTPADEAFDDIEGVESWAGDAIRALYSEGVIAGKGDKKFAPYDNVTRGEFAKMIVGAFNLSEMPDEYRGFTDVPSGHWCFSYVEVAANAGVVNGYEDGSFGIDDYITRQDMAVMVVRAAEAAGIEIADAGSSADFGDSASIADYASAAVESLVKAGIINGIDGNFEPASNANRAQAAKILANFI